MNKEIEFLNIISNTLADSAYLGDDCAYLKEYDLALSKDCLVEDVHFNCLMSPFEVGKKALLANVSDILCFGAKPKYALVGLGGKLDENFVKEFYKGLNEISQRYNIKIIGGDLFRADKITISITIVGDCRNRKISSRKNAKIDYVVAVAGEFGSSAQGFYDLKNGIKENYFTLLHKTPKLQEKIARDVSKKTEFCYAMMDSSDGLCDCLYRISKRSNIGIEIEYDKIPKKTLNKDFVLFGGEDYSLVVCLHRNDFKKIKGLIEIGKCIDKKGVFLDGKELKYGGFEHFE